MKKLNDFERKEWLKYKKAGQTNLHRCKTNAFNVSVANSLEHETAKLKIYFDLRKQGYNLITEADEISTGLRRDLTCLSTGEIYEVELFGNGKGRGHRHPSNINVFFYDILKWRNKDDN